MTFYVHIGDVYIVYICVYNIHIYTQIYHVYIYYAPELRNLLRIIFIFWGLLSRCKFVLELNPRVHMFVNMRPEKFCQHRCYYDQPNQTWV